MSSRFCPKASLSWREKPPHNRAVFSAHFDSDSSGSPNSQTAASRIIWISPGTLRPGLVFTLLCGHFSRLNFVDVIENQPENMMEAKKTLTSDSGAPVTNNQNSRTAGPGGPVLIEDHHLIEKLAHFDRERIPERVVHAKGWGAYGYFGVLANVTRQ